MAKTTTTKKNIFCLVLILRVLLGCCSTIIYKVGDSDGWTGKDNEWAKHKNFYVGDSLVFEYDPNVNDVTHVTEVSEYLSCQTSLPNKAVYNSGHDVVTFTEPGFYYFITSNYDQCKSGQKLHVLVVHDPSRPIPPPPPSQRYDIECREITDSRSYVLTENTIFGLFPRWFISLVLPWLFMLCIGIACVLRAIV